MPEDFLQKQMSQRFDAYHMASELREEKLGPGNAEIIYARADKYCSEDCKVPKDNPMTTCVNVCPVWKIKRDALQIKNRHV